jgi:hypothetical protein
MPLAGITIKARIGVGVEPSCRLPADSRLNISAVIEIRCETGPLFLTYGKLITRTNCPVSASLRSNR